jgi:hypothetical protein
MFGSSLVKAKILNLDNKSARAVECMFNPAQYTFTRSNTWEADAGGGANMPLVSFSGGEPTVLKMELWFDTYADRSDVRTEYTDKIWDLMNVDSRLADKKTKRSRPPMVRFQWGRSWTFDAVITELSQEFLLFLGDGTPVRCRMDVTFQQIKDTGKLKPQNPTSGGDSADEIWRVSAGDTLPGIAYRSYGDANQWRRIADANRLQNLRRLTPGLMLVIPHDE